MWRCNWRFKGLSDSVCLENVIYITKQEKVSIYYLSPFLGEFVCAKRKPNLGNVIGQQKNSLRKSWISSYSFTFFGSRNFYRLHMTSLTSTNVFTISCLSLEQPPPPSFGKFSSTARWKALQSLNCTIRRLFADYSSTIRRLFADYSYSSSTIRGLFALFVDYSRTIRGLFVNYSHYSFHYSSFINCPNSPSRKRHFSVCHSTSC
jgi:hypothetical protein